jgi:hypothetical protein
MELKYEGSAFVDSKSGNPKPNEPKSPRVDTIDPNPVAGTCVEKSNASKLIVSPSLAAEFMVPGPAVSKSTAQLRCGMNRNHKAVRQATGKAYGRNLERDEDEEE